MTSNFPELDPFAVERSHRTSQMANEHSRATGQAGILINGGAATAAIAFLDKKEVPVTILGSVPRCVALYAAGVFFGAVMMYCMTQTMEKWSLYWYYRSHGASDAKAHSAMKGAHAWEYAYSLSFVLTIGCFVVASSWLGYLLYAPR